MEVPVEDIRRCVWATLSVSLDKDIDAAFRVQAWLDSLPAAAEQVSLPAIKSGESDWQPASTYLSAPWENTDAQPTAPEPDVYPAPGHEAYYTLTNTGAGNFQGIGLDEHD